MKGEDYQAYEFGAFHLEPAERILLRDGVPVPLAPRVFDTLVVLVRHRGRLLEKNDLLHEVWNDRFVEEVNLSVNISALRKVLRDGQQGIRYIETVPKRGYRFVAPVTEVTADSADLIIERRLSARFISEEGIAGSVNQEPVTARAPSSRAAVTIPNVQRRRLALAALPVVTAAIAVAIFFVAFHRSPPKHLPFFSVSNVRLRKLTDTGKVAGAALSSDGQFFVYNTEEEGNRMALWLRRVGGKEALQLVPPTSDSVWSFVVSHDNNWVYYVQSSRDTPAFAGSIYRIASVGGSPRKLSENVQGGPALSPDDRRMVFDRFTATSCDLVTANAGDGGDERVIARSDSAQNYLLPQWSPDGNKILVVNREERTDGMYWSLAELSADGSASRILLPPRQQKIWTMNWADDGHGIVLNATDPVTKLPQLYYLTYPEGEIQRITNDVFYYNGASTGGNFVITAQKERPTKIWVTAWRATDSSSARELTGERELSDRLSWTPDGRIVYDSRDDAKPHIWIMDSDGQHRQQLSPDQIEDRLPDVSPDGRYIAFISNRSGGRALWLMDVDGRNARALTPAGAGLWSPRFAPDGQSIFIEMDQGTQNSIARVSLQGGPPVVVVGNLSSEALYDVSPDGRLLAYSFPDTAQQKVRVAVCPVGGGAPIAYFDIEPNYFLRWTPDGKALAYAQKRQDNKEGAALWLQRISGDPPQQVLSFPDDLLIWAAWSRDGKQLAYARGRLISDLVLVARNQTEQ